MDKISKSMTFSDYILVIGIILGPMTGLRIWKVGPAEVLILIWSILQIPKFVRLKVNNYHFIFWVLFLTCIIIGTAFGILNVPSQVKPTQIFTYVYLMFISLGIYVGLSSKEMIDIEKLLNKVAVYGTLWNFFLYIYSNIVSHTFINAPLWYAGARFSGGGNNPHQIAVFLGSIIFINYRSLRNSNQVRSIVKYILLIVFGIYLSIKTASSTLIISISFTTCLVIGTEIARFFKTKRNRVIAMVLLLSTSFSVILLNIERLYSNTMSWIEADPNGLGRIEIFMTITDSMKKSFLFGLGPGIHGNGGLIEYHNTYLEVIAMSGFIGFVIFISYNLKIIKICKSDIFLLFIITPLFFYGLAGFAMRRLVYWAILMIVSVLAEKQNKYTRIK